MVIKNMCLTRLQSNLSITCPELKSNLSITYRKADLVSFRSRIQTLASLTHFVALKLDQTPAVQSIHNLSRTEAGLQNAIATKPYSETGRISNQQKAEFVGNIFHIRSFCGGHGEILPKPDLYRKVQSAKKC
jgi:hypothetical protein